MLRRELLGGCGAGVVALAGCVSVSGSLDAEETITREYDGTDVSRVEAGTVNGDLEIDDESRGTIGAGTHRIAVETTNGDLTIRGSS